MNDDVSIKLPKGAVEGVVHAHIRAAITEALGRDPEALIRSVIDLAFAEKRNNYDRTTLFEEMVNKEIRQVATDEFRAWLEENRPKVRDQIRRKLRTVKFADAITENLAQNVHLQVLLKADY